MPKSSARVPPRPCLWLASLITLVVQSVLSYSSPSAYQRPAAGGKRPGFMGRTLVLLDVNTRSPIRVLNDNFLSLQLDPSIIKDGWLDFLRYHTAPHQHLSAGVLTSSLSNFAVFSHYARSHVAWAVMEWSGSFLPLQQYGTIQSECCYLD